MENKRKDELRLQLVQYLEENYIGERLKPYGARLANLQAVQRSEEVRSPSSVADQEKRSATHTIRDYLIDQADNETFTEYMLRIIKERDLKEADVYNRVFMDRRHFNRIRNDPEYQPSKRTAMLPAIALHLSLSETQEVTGSSPAVSTGDL